MNEELQELYKTDDEFREYVNRWCKNHNLSVDEAFNFNLLREYARYIKEAKHDR